MESQNQIEDMPSAQLKQNATHKEHISIEQKNKEKMKFNEFQRKRFNILCIQALLNRMKRTLENEIPITPTEQRNLLNSLYQFFELNVKDINIENYVDFHKLIPNPSATPIHIQFEQNSPEELMILPPIETLMEPTNTDELVR